MKKNILNKKIKDHLKSVKQHLAAYKKDNDPEHIHRLRVEIKKIKAIFFFIKKTDHKKYDLDDLKTLFNKAGEIRDLQMHIRILTGLDHLPEKFSVPMKNKILKLERLFLRSISKYIKQITSFQSTVSLPSELPDKKEVRKFFKHEIENAFKKNKDKDRKSMHRFRMKMKKLMYCYKALPKKLQKEIELNTSYIDKFQKKAGNWHDVHSTLEFISDKRYHSKVSAYIRMLKQKEKKQFDALTRLINAENNFFAE